MACNYYILENCPLDNLMEYFETHLQKSIDYYPDGIVIPVDKPYRWTSADVVRKIKFQLQKYFGLKKLKVGHAGTLDPLATGLLIVCVGKATKIAEELQAHSKEYIATIEFGATTSSFDMEQLPDKFYPFEHIDREAVLRILPDFIGEQEQVPPIFSAKSIGGLKAYEYARAGEPVELSKSLININDIQLLDFKMGAESIISHFNTDRQNLELVKSPHNYHTSTTVSEGNRPNATLLIKCSKGTYIRSLARDLGFALGSGGYLTSLRRTASGPFRCSF